MTGARALAAAGVLLVAASRPAPAAAAAEKVAVLVLATSDQDAELADNVTEVVIARVAARGGMRSPARRNFGHGSESRASGGCSPASRTPLASHAPRCRSGYGGS